MNNYFYKFIKISAIYISLIFHKVNYYGLENIPKNQGNLICCNHRSNWDPILISKPIKTFLYFLAKEELFRSKFMKYTFKKLGAIPISRGKKDLSAIKKCVDVINNKNFLVIFPEGTRSKNKEFLKPKSGAAFIAAKTNSNILPVRIIYHEPIRFRSKVDIIYGKTINFEDLKISTLSLTEIKSASNFIMESIKNLTPD